ncbi:MAG: helix-turn-helix domain-containing protein, partial [Bacteroidota bacterium]
MGITERKTKERQELKDLILSAAKSLFIEKGIDETSIRNIAERIEYSPATIYLYFKDKDEILHELHSQGFQELGSRMSVLMAVGDPFERLKA